MNEKPSGLALFFIGASLCFMTPVEAMEPTLVSDGLAIYVRGQGRPVLLFPYPHGSTTEPMADSVLADIFVGLGRTVITFDPPGAYRSSRRPDADMAEMLACAVEALELWGGAGLSPVVVDVAGHSMGGLCAIAFAVEHREQTGKLLLLNTTSGFSAVRRWGIHRHWSVFEREFWEIRYLGTRIMLGRASARHHDRLTYLNDSVSYHDSRHIPAAPAAPGNRDPMPVRDAWLSEVREVEFKDRLSEVKAEALITVGTWDPQTPPAMARELHEGIPSSMLVEFEYSGHAPFVEERELFTEVLARFLRDS